MARRIQLNDIQPQKDQLSQLIENKSLQQLQLFIKNNPTKSYISYLGKAVDANWLEGLLVLLGVSKDSPFLSNGFLTKQFVSNLSFTQAKQIFEMAPRLQFNKSFLDIFEFSDTLQIPQAKAQLLSCPTLTIEDELFIENYNKSISFFSKNLEEFQMKQLLVDFDYPGVNEMDKIEMEIEIKQIVDQIIFIEDTLNIPRQDLLKSSVRKLEQIYSAAVAEGDEPEEVEISQYAQYENVDLYSSDIDSVMKKYGIEPAELKKADKQAYVTEIGAILEALKGVVDTDGKSKDELGMLYYENFNEPYKRSSKNIFSKLSKKSDFRDVLYDFGVQIDGLGLEELQEEYDEIMGMIEDVQDDYSQEEILNMDYYQLTELVDPEFTGSLLDGSGWSDFDRTQFDKALEKHGKKGVKL